MGNTIQVQLRGKALAEAKALVAAMDAHRAGFDAYVAARTAGEDREPYRAAYTAWKRAYTAHLRVRKAARAAAGEGS